MNYDDVELGNYLIIFLLDLNIIPDQKVQFLFFDKKYLTYRFII